MKKNAFHVLRIGVGITFLWIGIMIMRSPEGWGIFIQPWAAHVLTYFLPIKQVMIETAFLDIAIGFLCLVNRWVWVAALVGTAHLVVVLITSGIDTITVRDIGLIGATAALAIDAMPDALMDKIIFKKSNILLWQ